MGLSSSEVQRIKYETGHNLLENGANPYIGTVSLFDQVIQPYLNTEVETTSSTTVTASTSPTAVTLTLGTVTGMTVGDSLIVDVDSQRERATIRNISGSTVSLYLTKGHTGTYPVLLESGESIVRDIIEKLDKVYAQIENAIATAGIKKVDEIEFAVVSYAHAESQLDSLKNMRDYWRDELCSALGIVNGWKYRNAPVQRTELY